VGGIVAHWGRLACAPLFRPEDQLDSWRVVTTIKADALHEPSEASS
jgi:hypothetical protein